MSTGFSVSSFSLSTFRADFESPVHHIFVAEKIVAVSLLKISIDNAAVRGIMCRNEKI